MLRAFEFHTPALEFNTPALEFHIDAVSSEFNTPMALQAVSAALPCLMPLYPNFQTQSSGAAVVWDVVLVGEVQCPGSVPYLRIPAIAFRNIVGGTLQN